MIGFVLATTFDQWADRIPVIGDALQTLGPIGTAVAAGFAGITLGLGALSNAARQAVQDIGNMKDAADAVGLAVEDFQAIRGVGMLSGVDRSEMESMLSTLAANSARASEGFGRMKTALDKVNPELSRQLALTTSQAERMNILAQATQEATNYNDKLNISIAAFGNSGGMMVAMLNEQGAAMDSWKERAMSAGLVLQQELVEAVDAMGDRLEAARARTEVAVQRLAVTMAPFEEWMETFKGDTAQGFAFLMSGDPFKSVEDQSTGYLVNESSKAQARYWTMRQRGVPEGSESFAGYAARIDAMSKELVRRYEQAAKEQAEAASAAAQEQLKADAESFGEWLNNWLVGEAQRDRAEAEKIAQEAARKAEEAARVRAAQEREAIEIRAQLGDWTSKLAAEEARLDVLVKAGVLTREEANASLARTHEELDGTAAAVQRWGSLLEKAMSPLERAKAQLAAFNADVAAGKTGNLNTFAVRWCLAADIEAARRAAEEANPVFRAIAEARERIARATEAGMTIEQRVALEWQRQTALIGKYGYTMAEAQKAVAAYRAELEKTTEAQRDNTFEIRFAAEVMGEILDENMNSLEDLGNVALRVFRSIAIEWILTNQKMAKDQGIFEFIGNALASSFGGGGTAGPTPGADKFGNVPVHHTGGAIGSTPVSTRWTNSSIFAGAPRMHGGGELRAGERAIIAEDALASPGASCGG